MSQHVTQLAAPERVSYRHGLRQPAQTLHLRVGLLPATLDWAALDGWLAQHLGVSAQPCPPAPPGTPQAGHAATALLWRVLLTGAALLRFGGVPVFEPGRLLCVRPDPGAPHGWLAQAAIAQVDYVPAQPTAQAYEAAALVVYALATRPHDLRHPEPLLQQLEAQVVGPLQHDNRSTRTTLAVLAAAQQAGLPWRHQGNGIYQLGWGARQQRLQGSQWEGNSSIGEPVARHKHLCAQWLRRAGLPVPTQVLVHDAPAAVQAAQALGGAVVVKPAVGVGGVGVTCLPRGEPALHAAFLTAAQVGGPVLVEAWVAGSTHLIHVVDAQVVRVLRRDPVGVQGDGRRTVTQLVATENQRRQQAVLWLRAVALPLDALALQCLAQAGFTADSVPLAGVWAPLRAIPNNADGGRDQDLTAHIHPDNVRLALAAVRRLGLRGAGVDLLSPDIRQPWHHNGAVIHDINPTIELGVEAHTTGLLQALLAQGQPPAGRIPLEVFVGDAAALPVARARQHHWRAQGVGCYLSTHDLTETPQGERLPLALHGAFARTRALLMDAQVQALVLVLHTDEWLHTGLPIDRISHLEITPGALRDHRTQQPLDAPASAALHELLRAHLSPPSAGEPHV